jgi:uncharacterized protein
MIEGIPLPVTDNPVDAVFWQGARRGELLVQHCGSCEEPRFPPQPRCSRCHSVKVDWRRVSGAGNVWSWVVPRPPLLPAFQDRSPFIVALVALRELPQIRMIGELAIASPGEVLELPSAVSLIGRPVHGRFRAMAEDVSLLYWELTD